MEIKKMNGLDYLTAQRWIKEIEGNQVVIANSNKNFYEDNMAEMEEIQQMIIAQNKLIDEYMAKQTELLEAILEELKNK